MSGTHNLPDLVWIVLCAGLVMLMQAGFCCLESGLARAKNRINVAIKNLFDFCVSSVVFWLFGFALMFGASWHGLVGTSDFALGAKRRPLAAGVLPLSTGVLRHRHHDHLGRGRRANSVCPVIWS